MATSGVSSISFCVSASDLLAEDAALTSSGSMKFGGEEMQSEAGVSASDLLAEDAAVTSSDSMKFGGEEMQSEEKPRPGTFETVRGITNSHFSFWTVIPNAVGGLIEMKTVYYDAWPSDDGWWMPPLHGEDVASLSEKLLEELDEQRHDYTQFTRLLGAHGCQCSSIEKDSLSCFEDEKQLPHPETGHSNPHAIERPPGAIGIMAAFFPSSREQGLLVRPGIEELERCLQGIPELGINQFKDHNIAAVKAVKKNSWEVACGQYEACLPLLESMENDIDVQTWLLLWVCVPLVSIYHLRLRNYSKCVITYDQMLQQLIRLIGSLYAQNRKGKTKAGDGDKNGDEVDDLIPLYYTIIWHRRLVLFEWSYAIEKDGNQLLADYVRSKVFNKVRVQKDHMDGFFQLQQMINWWGRRSCGRQGDMRVALCFNLEHLYRESEQHLKAVDWMTEKWRWIRDETHEPNQRWDLKLADTMVLFTASLSTTQMEDKAKNFVRKLELEPERPPIVSHTIKFWNAKTFLMESNWSQAETLLKGLQGELMAFNATSSKNASQASELLALVQFELSKLMSSHRSNKMLNYSPFGVEMISWNQGFDDNKPDANVWSDAHDRSALSQMENFKNSNTWKEVSENSGRSFPAASVPDLIHGQQLLNSLGKRFEAKDIEKYRGRLYDAMKIYEDTLRSIPAREEALRPKSDNVISHEVSESARRRIIQDQITCLESLGTCCAYAHRYKRQGKKYCIEDLTKELPVFDKECLEKGIGHLEKSLDLAQKSGSDHDVTRIKAKLGWVHFAEVKEYDDRLRTFLSLIPHFVDTYASLNEMSRIQTSLGIIPLPVKICGNPFHDHVYHLYFHQNEIIYLQKQKATTDPDDAFITYEILRMKNAYKRLGFRGDMYMITDDDLKKALKECTGFLIRGLSKALSQSTSYIKESLKRGYGRIQQLDTKSTNTVVTDLSMVETTKKLFTMFQHLMVHEHAVREVLANDCLLREIVGFASSPMIAEYLQSSPDDLTPSQKALIWAERGRSRSLLNQLAKNKLPEEQINNAANSEEFTDQDLLAIIEATRVSYGENTVFVEYTFDSTYEFHSDLTGHAKSQYNWKTCKWIVYVVTQGGKVHMRCYESEIPVTSAALIHNYMSEPEDPTSHDMVKENLEYLYDIFIRPIADLLPGEAAAKKEAAKKELTEKEPAEKLVFALDEILTNVPFPILRNSDTGKYLFEHQTISFTPTLRVLAHCEERHIVLEATSPKVAPSVALGDPAYPRSVAPLKGTWKEITGIHDLYEDGCVEILHGSEATANNLLSRTELHADEVQGFVHLAAHNRVDVDHKSGSLHLVYPTDPKRMRDREYKKMVTEKAFLRSEKIMQCAFEWRSCMVVLSACNSAKGYVLGSEGVVGLPRAFLVAGVPCTVASQWKVGDVSSSELMLAFHSEMRGGGDVASALRVAMLRMMKRDKDDLIQQVNVCKYGGFLVWGSPTVTLPSRMLKTCNNSDVNQASAST